MELNAHTTPQFCKIGKSYPKEFVALLEDLEKFANSKEALELPCLWCNKKLKNCKCDQEEIFNYTDVEGTVQISKNKKL